ncbi:MAG TPA: hypothetical protein DIT35_03960, partial [Rhodospirillaceae bacterium]|nr:hypothetical protein [Rhodospirillaceae bacterium]
DRDLRARVSVGLLLLASVALAGALVPIFGYWFAGRTHPNAIAGILPWNDAAAYYGCALSVLDGEGLSPHCQRRPAYSFYLAGLLRVAGAELQLALVLQGIMNGAAILIVAYAAMRRWGTAAALVTIAVLAPFAALTSVTTLTENLGFVLGAAGFLLTLSGAERRSVRMLTVGVFILSVALNARAGAFLVLPLIVIWPFLIADMSRCRRWRLFGMLVIMVAAGFGLGSLLIVQAGGSLSEYNSNFGPILYGLAVGGERWTIAHSRFPGATSGEIYEAAFDLIRTQPHLLLLGLLQGLLEYLQRLLTYIPWTPVRVVLGALWLCGIAALLRPCGRDGGRMLGLIVLGIFLSSPIISIVGDTRVWASTVAVDGFLAALGFAVLVAGITSSARRVYTALWGTGVLLTLALSQILTASDPRAWGGAMVIGGFVAFLAQRDAMNREAYPPAPGAGSLPALAVAMIVALITLVLPLPQVGLSSRVTYPVVTACPPGVPVIGRLGLDSPVVKVAGLGRRRSYWPVIAARDEFRAELNPLTNHYEDLVALPADTAIVFLYDRKPMAELSVRYGILTGPADLVPVDRGVYQVCVSGEVSTEPMDARRILSVHRVPTRSAVPR